LGPRLFIDGPVSIRASFRRPCRAARDGACGVEGELTWLDRARPGHFTEEARRGTQCRPRGRRRRRSRSPVGPATLPREVEGAGASVHDRGEHFTCAHTRSVAVTSVWITQWGPAARHPRPRDAGCVSWALDALAHHRAPQTIARRWGPESPLGVFIVSRGPAPASVLVCLAGHRRGSTSASPRGPINAGDDGATGPRLSPGQSQAASGRRAVAPERGGSSRQRPHVIPSGHGEAGSGGGEF